MAESEQVQLSFTNWPRSFADSTEARVRNRYFEQTPAAGGGAVMLARPGTEPMVNCGEGPIRATWSLPGLFDGSLFVVSNQTLYRVETDNTVIPIGGLVMGTGGVSMTGVAGAGYERLMIADGTLLQFYGGGTQASAILTGSGPASNLDLINIGGTYYQWVTTVGAGVGSLANPFKVLIGADLETDLANMVKAISFTGTSGVTYSSELAGQNLLVTAVSDATTMTVTARTDLAAGNDIVTTSTSATLTFPAATLLGGGTHGLNGIEIPDGLPPVSVATLKSHVLVALGNTDRFYWVAPAEFTIDPLNFATAESQPDDVLNVIVIGDTAMFIGEDSTEVWYATGILDSPFAPVSGRVYDRGAIEGTALNVNGTVFLVGNDNVVYAISGSANRVSTHAIEEKIRLTLASE